MAKTDFNQVLLDKWYSQEQINSMRDAVNSWQNAKDVVANVKPANTPVSTSTSTSWWPADWYATATERNMATGGAEFWRNNQTSNQTSNTPATPTVVKEETKTETVVETPEVKQEGALKPLSQEYYNQTSQDAQDKIVKNLNDYKKSNPEYFTDYESFKKNFSYDARTAEQKNTLDKWYKWYQRGLELSVVPTADLYTQYNSWDLSAWDLEILRTADSTKYSELMNQINKWNIITAYDDDKQDTTTMDFQSMKYDFMQKTFMNFMSGGSESWASKYFTDLKEKMNSPEMLELSDKTTEIDEKRDNILDDIASIQREVEDEYAWTWATRSKINAIIADRTYDLQQQLRTLDSEYKKYATQYNNRLQQYQNEFQLDLQEYQLQQQERQQMINELWFAMDLLSYETPEQQQERQWEYWVRQQEYSNWDINSKDYSTRYKAALKSVQNLLSQYEWIPMSKSAEQMAQDVLNAIDAWSDLWTELTKINKEIQGTKEYKYVYNQTFGSNAWSGLWKTFKLWDTEYVEWNDEIYTADQFNKLFGGQLNYTPVSEDKMLTWLESFKKKMQSLVNTWGAIRKWWCWEPVNDYLKSIGSDVQYDNEKSTKLNSITPWAWPKVWSIAIWDGSNFNSPAAQQSWHVAIVTWVNPDKWTITVLESNWQAKSMGMWYGEYLIKNVTWYFDPSGWQTASQGTKDAFTAAWNNIALNLWSVSATNTFNETLKKYVDGGDYTRAFEYITTQAKQATDTDTRSALNSAESAISALVSIRDWLDAYKAAWGDTNIFAWTAEQVANKIWQTTDPELKKLATQINVAIQNYRKAISGAAFSEAEAAEYAAIFPSTKNSKELNDALIDWALQTMLQNLNSNYSQILGNETYVDLLKAYEDSTWDIYDYYGNKQWLTEYLRKNWYFDTSRKTDTQKWKRWWSWWSNAVVEPNMSSLQTAPVNDLWNWIMTRTVNGTTQYSYDWWRSRR